MADPEVTLNPQAGRLLLDHAIATWVQPEMERLGLSPEAADRGVILFPPRGEPKVVLGAKPTSSPDAHQSGQLRPASR